MNKCRLFVLLVLAAVVSSIEPQNKLQEGVLKIIENWRRGSGSLPIAIKSLPLKFTTASCTYDGYSTNMDNLQINGLENMSVLSLSANERMQSMTLSVVVNVPTVTIRTDWARVKKNGWFSSLFSDSGVLSGQIDNLTATAELQLGLQRSSTVVKSLSLDFSVDGATFYLSQATHEYITNEKLKEKVSKMIRNKDYGFIRSDVIEAINNYLRGQTPDQLIAKIKAYV